MPSATIPTTVATGIRVPRVQGTPPMIWWSTLIRSNITPGIVRQRRWAALRGPSGCCPNVAHVADLGRPEVSPGGRPGGEIVFKTALSGPRRHASTPARTPSQGGDHRFESDTGYAIWNS